MTEPFFSEPKKTFAEAYPQISKLTIKVKTNSKEMTFTEKTIPSKIPCNSRVCNAGGFDILFDLEMKAFSKKLSNYKGLVICKGHEKMGGKKTRSCLQSLEYEAEIEYK